MEKRVKREKWYVIYASTETWAMTESMGTPVAHSSPQHLFIYHEDGGIRFL
jgi:hypothetical protein